MHIRTLTQWTLLLCMALAWPGLVATAQDEDGGDGAAVAKPAAPKGVNPLNAELFAAIGRRDAKAVKELLDRGADSNATDGMWGGNPEHWLRTPLIEAARLGELEIVRLLLAKGADPRKSAPLTGGRPIGAALRTYEPASAEILRLLQQAGDDLNAPPPATEVKMSDFLRRVREKSITEGPKTQLHTAVAPGRDARRHNPLAAMQKAEMLIKAGFPLDSRNALDQTALVFAVAEGRYQGRESQLNVLKALLSHKPDLDAQDADGRAALHHAVIHMDAVVAKMLLDAGAKTDLKDEDGRTPADLAREIYPRADVLKVLGLDAPVLPANGLRAHIHPSRLRGVAPLAVFLDGVGTDGLADDDYVNAYYDWDFDTTRVALDEPRRIGIGFNTAYVFRKPGVYTVTMRVKDTAGKQGDASVTIEVLPFEGRTFHVAATGDDANPGTMDKPWKTPAFAFQQAAPDTRILFRRGDEFASNGMSLVDKKGPVVIGAYTDEKRPSDVAPLIHGQGGFALRNVEDWRFVGLHMKGLTTERGAKDSGGAFNTFGVRNVLLLDLEMERFGNNVITDVDGRNNSDGLFIVDCHLHDAGACGTFIQRATRVGYIGNHLQRLHSFEHGYRSQGTVKGYLAHNTFGKDLGVAKSAIQIRGHTRQVVIAFNRIADTASFAVTNTGTLDFVHHCLADSNILTSGFTVGAQNITFRRNRMKYEPLEQVPGKQSSQAMSSLVKFGAHMDWAGVCENIQIYNNTYVGPTFLGATVHNARVCDNIIVGPAGLGAVVDSSDGNLYHPADAKAQEAWLAAQRAKGQDKNSKTGDPAFLSLDPASPDFLKPASGGPGEGLGARVFEK